MDSQSRKAWVLVFLVAAIFVAALVVAELRAAGRCTNLAPQEWENASSEPVFYYAARNEDSAVRGMLQPGDSFRPARRCGDWLEVPTWYAGPPVYVRVDEVERVPQAELDTA
jgi:hypothetical protein